MFCFYFYNSIIHLSAIFYYSNSSLNACVETKIKYFYYILDTNGFHLCSSCVKLLFKNALRTEGSLLQTSLN